jgi:hypothetical protein
MDLLLRFYVSVPIVLFLFFLPFNLFNSVEIAQLSGGLGLIAAFIWISTADDFPKNFFKKSDKYKPYR